MRGSGLRSRPRRLPGVYHPWDSPPLQGPDSTATCFADRGWDSTSFPASSGSRACFLLSLPDSVPKDAWLSPWSSFFYAGLFAALIAGPSRRLDVSAELTYKRLVVSPSWVGIEWSWVERTGLGSEKLSGWVFDGLVGGRESRSSVGYHSTRSDDMSGCPTVVLF